MTISDSLNSTQCIDKRIQKSMMGTLYSEHDYDVFCLSLVDEQCFKVNPLRIGKCLPWSMILMNRHCSLKIHSYLNRIQQ